MSGSQPNENNSPLDSVLTAIEAIKAGKMVIVVDDENRENEGDFVAAAECITPEMINFMATEGRGLICVPLPDYRCDELGLDPMVQRNTELHQTAFTVSVDLLGHGVTTGISASDRAKTIQALIHPDTKPEHLARPGHIFPLRARKGGVLRRTGHTEAAIDLARLAGLQPAGVIVEIMNPDGTMARLPQLLKIAKQHSLPIISIEDMVAYRMQHESLIKEVESFILPTPWGEFHLRAFEQTTNGQVHIALSKGEWKTNDSVLVRMHSTGTHSDVFHLLTSGAWQGLERALQMVGEEGQGVIVYMNQAGNEQSLLDRLRRYRESLDGRSTRVNTPNSFTKDPRDFGVGAQILHAIGVKNVRLLTNNPIKRVGIEGYGLRIVDNVSMQG
jgi:3,4-dihydroxy 2-butanone 4-phosphate synthase / GTP cyclohydrolase II